MVPEKVAAQITSEVVRDTDGDPLSIERGVRQRLADKISDTMAGLWLLVPEHLRLGTWDLLCGWTQQPTMRVEPRLALQLVHEAALCLKGVRERRSVALRGFEILNGLPFLATDTAVHHLLDSHTVAQAQELQVALGKIRRVSGDFAGKLLLIDPHRPCSYSRRHMRRHRKDSASKPKKTAQMFFCLDGDTEQPLCCMIGTSARTVTQATPELLELAAQILHPVPQNALVAADTEHFSAELIDYVHLHTPFDIITPISAQSSVQNASVQFLASSSRRGGPVTLRRSCRTSRCNSRSGPYHELVQRQGERPDQWHFNSFLSTTDRDPLDALTLDYPKALAPGGVFQFQSGVRLAARGHVEPQHPLRSNEHGDVGPGGDPSTADAVGRTLPALGRASTWQTTSSAGWKGTFALSGTRSW